MAIKSYRGIYLAGFGFLVMSIAFSSCKNKKKATEISDPQEVRAQIEEELSREEEPEAQINYPERKAVKEPTRTEQLENYFGAIATGSVAASNKSIDEALSLFTTPESPVLVIIYQSDGSADYDEPTTARKYLEYLKDTKNNKAKVEEMVLDEDGKIKELVLKK